jgi:hypothetical protein
MSTPAFSDKHHTWIYDRHPMISERIYGPIVRGKVPGNFNLPSWVDRMLHLMYERCLVVWCLPPYVEVMKNVVTPAAGITHMNGVEANIHAIYAAYNEECRVWKGPSITHNYVMNPPGSHNRGQLIARIRRMAQEG